MALVFSFVSCLLNSEGALVPMSSSLDGFMRRFFEVKNNFLPDCANTHLCCPMAIRAQLVNWSLFIGLSFIWGSSFILMKVGLNTLTAYQVAALRIFSAGIFLMPVAVKKMRQIPFPKLNLIIISGLLGS